MLQRIRDSLQAQRWLAIVILGALALVFGAWGAYGIVDLGVGGGNYAAKVNGEKISTKDASEAWQRQQQQWQQRFGADLPAELKSKLQEQLLESMVRDSLIGKWSHDQGYRVSDEQIHEEIRRVPAFQGVDGKYDPQAARMAISNAGMTVETFEASIRRDLQRSQVEMGLRVSDFLTPYEAQRLQALKSEQREVRYAVVSADKFAADAKVDDAAVQAYYTKNQARFMTPEYVKLAYAELRLDQVASQIPVGDEDLKAAYEKNKDKYVQAEKRHAHHILIEAGKDDAAALKKAQAIYAEAKSGKDFAELAKKNSQDPGSAQNGGDLGWAERTAYDPAFADALFAMSVGEIRGPVKSQYGYHIIKLDEVQAGATRAFADVRSELEADVRKDKAADRFGDTQEQLQQKLEQPGADFDALAKQFNMQPGEVAQYLRGTGGAPLGESKDLEEVVFSNAVLDEHRVGGPVALGEDRLVIVKALDHHKPEAKPLATVRDEIVAAIKKEQGTLAAVKAVEAARAKLDAGTPFDEVVKSLSATADAAHFVGRDDPSVPQPIRDATFKGPKPANGKHFSRAVDMGDGGMALLAVTSVRTEPNPSPDAEAAAKRTASMIHGQGDAVAYLDELRRTAKVSTNPKAFEE